MYRVHVMHSPIHNSNLPGKYTSENIVWENKIRCTKYFPLRDTQREEFLPIMIVLTSIHCLLVLITNYQHYKSI